MDPFGPILTYLDPFGQSMCHLEQFGALWTNWDAIGPIEGVIYPPPQKVARFLFVPKKSRNLLGQEVACFFFVPRGCMIFLSREVAKKNCPERLPDFFPQEVA